MVYNSLSVKMSPKHFRQPLMAAACFDLYTLTLTMSIKAFFQALPVVWLQSARNCGKGKPAAISGQISAEFRSDG
jgi:hypothetical protein